MSISNNKYIITFVLFTASCFFSFAQGSGFSVSGFEPAYVDCGPSKTDLNFPYTVEAWVKFGTTPSNAHAIWDSGVEPSGLYFGSWFLVAGTGQVGLVYGDGTGLGPTDRRSMFSVPTIPIGEWVHVCGVQDGPLAGRIYFNGVEVPVTYSGTGGTTIVHFPGGVHTIGWHESLIPGIYLDGEIDEVRVWNVGRTASEIRETMCRKLTGSEPGLEAYWRFDDGVGTTVPDLTGSGYDGTFVGAMNWQLSGAPIGDVSNYTYPGSWAGESLPMAGPGGEQFIVSDVLSSVGQGVHIYRVDDFPNNLTGLPPGTPDYYYGVFSTSYTSSYSATASLVDSACTNCIIDWVTRNDNAAGPWFPLAGSPSTSGCTLTKNGESAIDDSWRAEYAWSDTAIYVASVIGDTTFNSICPGDSVFVKGNWLSMPGIYTIFSAGPLGCDSLSWYALDFIPTTNGDTLSFVICEGDSVFANGSWFSIPGSYTFLNTGFNGCDSLSWVSLDLEPCPDDSIPVEPGDTCIVALPNAFSPNQDGLNDLFGIPEAVSCPDLLYFELVIFNRWGQIIWQTNNQDVKWDGTFKGVEQELGVYVWVMRFQYVDAPSPTIETGTVTLIR